MRLLLDACVWSRAAEPLREIGHDVIWVGDWPADPGDDVVLATAFEQGRILITLDKDLGEIAVLGRVRHSGIIRLVGIHPQAHASTCADILARHGQTLAAGAIVTASASRWRIRTPE